MATVGRESRFPLDVELYPTPSLNNIHNSALFQYLRNVDSDSVFATSVLQILIEERRVTHREHYNKNKLACTLKFGDVVKAHVQFQSSADKEVASKLSYRAKYPITVTKDLRQIVSKYSVMITQLALSDNIKVQNFIFYPWHYSRLNH